MSAVSVVAWLLGAVALAAINNGESFSFDPKSSRRVLETVAAE